MSSNPGLHNFLGKHSVYDILGAKPKPDDPDHIPMNYNSVFTNLGNLHNTRAVITAKIHLDLQSALNFCQLFRFAWPKSLPARTAALMSGSPLPADLSQQQSTHRFWPAGHRSSKPFMTVYNVKQQPQTLVNPLQTVLNFITAADNSNQTDLAMLAATALYRFNSTCNNWPLLKNDRLTHIKDAMRRDPLATERDRPLRRRKRNPVAVAGGAAVGAAATGLYFWIKSMSQSAQLAEHASAINTLSKNADLAQAVFTAVEKHLSLNSDHARSITAVQNIHNAAERIEHNVEQYETAFSNAVSGQLTLGAITTKDLNTIYVQALKTAYSNGYYLPITSATDLLNLPTTAETVGHTHIIQFVIPIADKMISIYSLTPTPIVAHDNTADNAILINIEAQNSMLGSTSDSDGNTLTAPINRDFLAACIVIDNGHVCYNRLGLSKTPHTCIEALFTKSRTATTAQCTFKTNPNTWAAAVAPDNTVYVATTQPMNATVTCESTTSSNSTLVKFNPGSKAYKLPTGCSIRNDLFTVAGLPFKIKTISIQKFMAFNIHLDILEGQSIQTLLKATQTFIEHGQKPPEIIKDLLNQFEKLPTVPVDTALKSTWNIFFMLILIIIIAGGVLYVYVRHIRGSTRRHKHYSRQAYTDLASMITGREVQEQAFIPKKQKTERRSKPKLTDITRATGVAINRAIGRHQGHHVASPATRARRAMLAAQRPPRPQPPLRPAQSYHDLLRQQQPNEYMELRELRRYDTPNIDTEGQATNRQQTVNAAPAKTPSSKEAKPSTNQTSKI